MIASRRRPALLPLCIFIITALSFCAQPQAGAGKLTLAGVFGHHAVLQREVRLPVWGKAAPGASVEVGFAGQRKSVLADEDGLWRLELDPLKASAKGRRMTVRSEGAEIPINDLVVGEVWLASGQSNMQFSLGACARRLDAVKKVMVDPEALAVRMLRIGSEEREKPLDDLDRRQHRWAVDSPQIRPGQSAVAFFFARRLQAELGVPVGIIETSWGGKPIEGFIPREQFPQDPRLKPILELADANRLEELARLEGGVVVRNKPGLPGRIFNGRLAPVAPYAVRGAIWYQAESNAGRGEDPRNYRHKMRALVEGWRETWGQEKMPVYFVQLPGFKDSAKGWVRVREEQRLSLGIPDTGMAVTIDLLDEDIHPANKIDVGERLAGWALAREYGRKEVAFSGPLFKSAQFVGGTATVVFDHANGGLMTARKLGVAPPQETPEVAPGEFELADESGNWHRAEAKIKGETVVVRTDAVNKAIAVRYACRGAPTRANLYNRAGLPASPFCSDLKLLPWMREE